MVSIFQGTTAKFSFTFPEYPPADWDAVLVLKSGLNTVTYLSQVTGDAFNFKITPAETTQLCAGFHDYVVKVTKKTDETEVSIAATGQINVNVDPSLATDARTALEKDLDAVDAAITAILEGGAVHSYEIQTNVGKRSLERMSLADLRKHRMWIRGQIDEERVRLGLKPRMASMKKTFKFCP